MGEGAAMKIPVMGIIWVAALLSTTASITGGLVMYFESIASLEETVDTISEGELRSLADGIMHVQTNVLRKAPLVRNFFYELSLLPAGAPWQDVEDMARLFLWAQLAAQHEVFELAVIVIPRNRSDPLAPTYLGSWVSPMKGAQNREYVFGSYSAAVANASRGTVDSVTPDGAAFEMQIRSYDLDPQTGARRSWLYEWNAVSYINDLVPPQWDPASGRLPGDGLGWTDGSEYGVLLDGAVAVKHRPPGVWWAEADMNVYIYGMYDVMFAPPPPPHPWSDCQTINFAVGFLYTAWEDGFAKYRRTHPDTTVLAVDTKSEIIYASTTDETMLKESCKSVSEFSSVSVSSCVRNVSALSSHHQRLYAELRHAPSGKFGKWTSDGTAYYVRKERVFDNVALLWLRPVSSVDQKVQSALVLLLVFTALVFLFDVLLSLMEVMLIAQPLRDVNVAVEMIGGMETELAAARLRVHQKRAVVVSEMDSLVAGMLNTIDHLENFRSFLPASVLRSMSTHEDAEVEGADNEESIDANEAEGNAAPDLLREDSEDSEASSNISAAAPRPRRVSKGVFALQLLEKRVSVVVVNVVRFVDVGAGECDEMLKVHSALLEWLVGAAAPLRGVIDNFSGDRFFVSFNASKSTASRRVSAGTLAHDFGTHCGEVGLVPSAGVASGSAKVGNLGSRTMRKYSFISALVPFVHALERHARNLGVAVLCCTETHRELQHSYHTLCAGHLLLQKYHPTAVCVFWVTSLRARGKHAEWMYELSSTAENDPHKDWNALMGAVLTGSWSEAAALRDSIQDRSDMAEGTPLRDAVRTAIDRCEYTVPDFTPYY
eukprot:TRINITY_DN5243_c1_g1_i2.p1 TRINITY_DN5243_c1_g1~~TRINITY_DN5243_c1_g1_i2.p1  ORF type:complete len:838 (+),score=271.97 TRINITY_DN5243_c1_g1_i2:32-2515(+)